MLRVIGTFCQIVVATVISSFLILMGTGYANKMLGVVAAEKVNVTIFDLAVVIAVTLALMLCTAIFACLRLNLVLTEMQEMKGELGNLASQKPATVPPPVRRTG